MSERDQEESSYDIEQHSTNEEMMDVDPVGEESAGSNIAEQDAEINQNDYDKLHASLVLHLKELKNLNEKQGKTDETLEKIIEKLGKNIVELGENNEELNRLINRRNQLINTRNELTRDLNECRQYAYPLRYLSQAQLDDCVQDIKKSETAIISGKVLNPENLQEIAKADQDDQDNLSLMFYDIMEHLLRRPKYKYDYDLMGKIHRVILTFPFDAWCTNRYAEVSRDGSNSKAGFQYHFIKPVIVGNYQETLSRWLQEADAYIVEVMTRRFMIEPDSYYDNYCRQAIRRIVEIDFSGEKELVYAIDDHYVRTCSFLLGQAFIPLSSDYGGLFGNLKPNYVHSKPMTDYEPNADELNRVLENHLIEEEISFQPYSEDLRRRERHLINRQLITKSASVSAKMEAYRSEVKETFRRKLIYDHWKKGRKAAEPIAVFSQVEPNLAAIMCKEDGNYQIKEDDISRSIFLEQIAYSAKSGLTFCLINDYFVSLVLNIEWESHRFKELRKEYDDKEKQLEAKLADLKKKHLLGRSEKGYEVELKNLESTMLARPVVYSMERIDEGKSRYTSVAVLFALVYHGLTMSDDERAEQEKVIRELSLYVRKSADFTIRESEVRLANMLPLDVNSSKSDITHNIDPLTLGVTRRMIDCRCQKWTGFELLQDEWDNTQVYLFDFDTISSYIPDLKTDIKTRELQRNQKLVMKVYNIDLTSIHYTYELSKGFLPLDMTLEEYEKMFVSGYFNEIESYHRIIKYNNSLRFAKEKKRINIPELYKYGSIRVYSEENGHEFTGPFIIMEYIDSQPESLSNNALKRCQKSLKRAAKLGICHNDIKPKNVLVKDGQMVLIDFALASLSNSRVDNSEDMYYLERVWDHMRSNGLDEF